MPSGHILFAIHHGTYVLKFTGEVRAPMCATLDDFLEKMFVDSELSAILVDLTETDYIDSTALGMIAKTAVFLQMHNQRKPIILSTNPDITRLLESMGFDQVFIILACECHEECLNELPESEPSEHEMMEKVISAHRVLMGLSEQNQATFKNLVEALELEQQSHGEDKI
ncbi:MAG TPA: STAS domain-containing protein [Agitococcus sp.]|uniref:STAS domain-containing protein n=1 Tax=uncultured Agitococcus sp. TaxID=1506599 RepID=UPI002632FFCF|nr:STAS domain-containing protein [uncultured Agitococcus sp.]HMU86302.1 STAS domain-containing protein [Agitococcus sp.]HMV59942.1 STAS domain-containing protein [Agitococcus sp.]HMX98232.1 STAS domain-containing protein [Agitococcus sp.]HMY27629.1 STAS domain-containing protein [Agitococcus sp.]HMY81305.1 STAS domain-containing protein [Agitococcus sp.]